jgi:hypothetical protein
MEIAFVSFQFRDPRDPLFESEREVETNVEKLLSDHGIRSITGERSTGESITDAVRREIERSDCLVAIMTRRDELASGDRWTTSDWVKAELEWAHTSHKRAIALIEQGVEVGGPVPARGFIPLDRGNLLPALMALSGTIGRWRREAGSSRIVRLLPDEIGELVRQDRRYECRYRQRRGRLIEEWEDVEPVVEPGGTFLYLDGIYEDAAVEVEILANGATRWWSPATPQFIPVELQETV